MKKQYLVVLFIAIFVAYSSAEEKKENQSNPAVTDLISSSSLRMQQGVDVMPELIPTRYGAVMSSSADASDFDWFKTIYGIFKLPQSNSTHYSAIPFSIEVFDDDGIKEISLRFRQNGSTIGRFDVCDDGGSSPCEGKTINENVSVNPLDYSAVNGTLEVDLVLVNEESQQSELATVSILNWERFAPYGTFISPRNNLGHRRAIFFSIEAFDDDGFKQIDLTLKKNGNPFINLALCGGISNVCTGKTINKDVTVDPEEYGIDDGIITVDLWSVDGRNINNKLKTLNLDWTSSFTEKLNDTGITWSGNDFSGNNETCTSNIDAAQDCQQGRDAQAVAGRLEKIGGGNSGFDFTKLDANGNALTKQDGVWNDYGNSSDGTKWSCVRDNYTGLIWEVKTNDNGIHDKDRTYRWGGKTAIGKGHPGAQGNYYDDWNELVDGTNSENLCGFNDWRVPKKEELRSVINYGRSNPPIDTNFFPNTAVASYWSSSPSLLKNIYSWRLMFIYGLDGYGFRNRSYHVRLVRFGQ